jgi:hypothetical protein
MNEHAFDEQPKLTLSLKMGDSNILKRGEKTEVV